MDKKTKAILGGAAAAAAAGINSVRAYKFKPQEETGAVIEDYPVDVDAVAAHLTSAIQYKTISHQNDQGVDWNEFDRFHKFLDETFPLITKTCEKEVIGKASLLYRWKGTNPDLDPIALLCHQDVVPISEGTESDWTHDPWSGFNDGTYIWGRGALDMKDHLMFVMESVESLMKQGFRPERDVYLCLGHNEEIVSTTCSGAKLIAETLQERGVHLDSTLDEGSALLRLDIPGLAHTYVTAIGVGEKGQVNMKFTLQAQGGHTSIAPKHSGMNMIANTVKDIENHPFPSRWLPFMDELMDQIGRHTTFLGRSVMVNFKAIRPAVQFIMSKIPSAASLVHTVQGVTMAEGSMQPNVLPQRPSLTVNFRPLQGDSIDDVERHLRRAIRYKDVEIERDNAKEATRLCSTDSRAFKAIRSIENGLHPGDVAVAPFLVMGGTDSYHYEDICENCLRFAPVNASVDLLETTHGTNERIPLSTLKESILFFREYIKTLSAE